MAMPANSVRAGVRSLFIVVSLRCDCVIPQARKTHAPMARCHGCGPKNQVCGKLIMPADGMRAVASPNWDSALPLRQLAFTLPKDRDNGKAVRSSALNSQYFLGPVAHHVVRRLTQPPRTLLTAQISLPGA